MATNLTARAALSSAVTLAVLTYATHCFPVNCEAQTSIPPTKQASSNTRLPRATGSAGQIRKVGNVVVFVPETAPASGVPLVKVQRAGEPTVTIELNNRTAKVEDIKFVGRDSIVIHGKTYEQYPRMDSITVIDTASKKIVDTIWALDASFSPDGKTVAYFYRAPHTSQGVLWTALVAYDLTAPDWNARWGGAKEGPREGYYDRGVVLYPDRHRQARRYWFLLSFEEGELREGRDRHGFVSQIAWSPDSKRIAVVEGEGLDTRLVVIDISQGLLKPAVSRVTVPAEPFIKPMYATTMPEDYAGAWVFVQKLEFTPDGGSVILTSRSAGPYEEKTITLPVPAAGPQP